MPGSSHKISLFADDILLTLTFPRIFLQNLLSLLHTFTSLSGLPVKPSKSKALSIKLFLPVLTDMRSVFQFHWLSSVPYLGICPTSSYAGLYQANFPPLFKRLSDMLSSWSHLPLSWFGRITAIRMSYLPKLLYFFFSLTCFCPLTYFTYTPTQAFTVHMGVYSSLHQ